MNQKRNLNGSGHHTRLPDKAGKADINRQIRKKSCKNMGRCIIETRRSTFADITVVADTAQKTFVTALSGSSIFVDVDLHKTFLRVAVADDKGSFLMNKKIENRCEEILHHFELYCITLPENFHSKIDLDCKCNQKSQVMSYRHTVTKTDNRRYIRCEVPFISNIQAGQKT